MAGDNFDALRKALADGPTAGPWRVDEDDRPGMAWNRHIMSAPSLTVCFMAHSDGDDNKRDKATAYHIAACDPTAIRALLAERDALQAKVATLALDAMALDEIRLGLDPEVEAMKRDAERYAWLRKEARIAIAGQSVIRSTLKKGTPFVEFPNWIRASDFRADPHPEYRDNFDAAIDAARAALAQPTGEKP